MTLMARITAGLTWASIVGLVLLAARPAAAIESTAKEALLMDLTTDTVLFAKDADKPMPPASMSKMMTVYMLFERLRDGSLSLDDTFRVSERAWRKGGARSGSSTMFLKPNSRVRVEDLIRGIVVQSGNDACIAVAESLASSEEAFAEQMTARARELGLENSTFRNATGWPHPEHRMSPRDLALLAKHTIENFPEYYHYYSEKSFTYNEIRQHNRNPLLYWDMGADGLKTGHTKEAGYGLVSSAKRGARRLVLIVNGLPTKKARSKESERLLEWGFREFENYALFQEGETVLEAGVWLGEAPTVPLVIEEALTLTLPRKARRNMTVSVKYQGPLPAPVTRGTELARLVIMAPGVETREIPLVAGTDVKQLGFIGRVTESVKFILFGGPG